MKTITIKVGETVTLKADEIFSTANSFSGSMTISPPGIVSGDFINVTEDGKSLPAVQLKGRQSGKATLIMFDDLQKRISIEVIP